MDRKEQHVVLAVAVVSFLSLLPVDVLAVSCTTGTFADYIGLGATGCTIEDKVFANFYYTPDPNFPMGIGTGSPTLPGVTFSSNPPAEQISVVPLAQASNPGLHITAGSGWGVDGTTPPPLNISLGFTVTVLPGGALIKDETLSLLNASRFGSGMQGGDLFLEDANVRVFLPPVGFTPDLFDESTFTPVSMLAVDLRGQVGFGQIREFEQHFSEVVPEPSTVWLLGTGLMTLIALGRKTFRRPRCSGRIEPV